MAVYFGFALADSMFAGDVTISRRGLSVEEVREIVGRGVVPCLNPTHAPTIGAMRELFGIEVEIPETAPRVFLDHGDSVVVMGVRGLSRLEGRHEYTADEISSATFSFSIYTAYAVIWEGFVVDGFVHGGGGISYTPFQYGDPLQAWKEACKINFAYGDSARGLVPHKQ